MLKLFLLLICLPASANADILMPTFYAHHTDRTIYGEQRYRASDISGILWQLNYWSFESLPPSAVSQALNAVLSGQRKHSGLVETEDGIHDLYHASAGTIKGTATLFFINEGENQRIIGIAKHVETKINQPPSYKIISWDKRYRLT